jgi:hypothetical protein
MPIDTAISRYTGRNVINRQAEKILQYEDLATEVQDMWNVKTKVMLVTTEAAGTMPKSYRKFLSNMLRKHEIRKLQRTATLSTVHLLRQVLM